jgi:putative transcriptional regulator
MGRVKRRGRLSNQIRRLRFEADGMTQQELADLVGVTRQTVIAMEADRYAPSLEVAFRIVPVEGVFQYQES